MEHFAKVYSVSENIKNESADRGGGGGGPDTTGRML